MVEGQDISRILLHYGAEEVPEGRWRGMKCPFHHDTRASARVNTDAGGFKCLGCGIGGDAISLIMKWEGVDFVSAKSKYEIITGKTLPDVPRTTTNRRRKGRRRLSDGGETAYDQDAGLFSSGIRRRPTSGR